MANLTRFLGTFSLDEPSFSSVVSFAQWSPGSLVGCFYSPGRGEATPAQTLTLGAPHFGHLYLS